MRCAPKAKSKLEKGHFQLSQSPHVATPESYLLFAVPTLERLVSAVPKCIYKRIVSSGRTTEVSNLAVFFVFCGMNTLEQATDHKHRCRLAGAMTWTHFSSIARVEAAC